MQNFDLYNSRIEDKIQKKIKGRSVIYAKKSNTINLCKLAKSSPI